ncbi:hypothetical protein ACWGQ5_46715, partial [Streptomyces sp. NPDC055722]
AAKAVFGAGTAGVIRSVAAAVAATGIAGVLLYELRRRSSSLIPPMALHCALNSFGHALAWAAADGSDGRMPGATTLRVPKTPSMACDVQVLTS